MPYHSNGWRGWLLAAMTLASMAVGGWYGSTVWATQARHAERLTRAETQIEGLHDTLRDIKDTLGRVDQRVERMWERGR